MTRGRFAYLGPAILATSLGALALILSAVVPVPRTIRITEPEFPRIVDLCDDSELRGVVAVRDFAEFRERSSVACGDAEAESTFRFAVMSRVGRDELYSAHDLDHAEQRLRREKEKARARSSIPGPDDFFPEMASPRRGCASTGVRDVDRWAEYQSTLRIDLDRDGRRDSFTAYTTGARGFDGYRIRQGRLRVELATGDVIDVTTEQSHEGWVVLGAGDFDEDGAPEIWLDLRANNYIHVTIATFEGCAIRFGGDEGFSAHSGQGGHRDFGCEDINGDGRREIVEVAETYRWAAPDFREFESWSIRGYRMVDGRPAQFIARESTDLSQAPAIVRDQSSMASCMTRINPDEDYSRPDPPVLTCEDFRFREDARASMWPGADDGSFGGPCNSLPSRPTLWTELGA